MVSLFARAILWFLLAFFLYETVNEFNRLFGLSINPYLAVIPVAIVYGIQEMMIKKGALNGKEAAIASSLGPKTGKVIAAIFWIFLTGLLLSVCIIWLAVIYKHIIS